MKRYQIVWWGWRDRCWNGRMAYTGGMALIYEWTCSIGPLEIRKWKPRAGAKEKGEDLK